MAKHYSFYKFSDFFKKISLKRGVKNILSIFNILISKCKKSKTNFFFQTANFTIAFSLINYKLPDFLLGDANFQVVIGFIIITYIISIILGIDWGFFFSTARSLSIKIFILLSVFSLVSYKKLVVAFIRKISIVK